MKIRTPDEKKPHKRGLGVHSRHAPTNTLTYESTTATSSAEPTESKWSSVASHDLYEVYNKKIQHAAAPGGLPSDNQGAEERKSLIDKEDAPGTLTVFQVTINMTKQMFGAGILAFAQNGYNGGMLSVLLLVPLAGLISIFAAILLVKAVEALEARKPGLKLASFEDVAREAFNSKKAEKSMQGCFAFTLFVISIIYVGVPASYLTKLFPGVLGLWQFTLIFACFYVPLAWFKSMRLLGKFAVLGVVACLISMVVIAACAIRYGMSDGNADFDWFPKDHKGDNGETPILKFIGSFVVWAFGYGAILITPSQRNSMKDKSQCIKAVIASHTIVTVTYICMLIPVVLGFANASLWSGDIVELMNDPIMEPKLIKNKFQSFGEAPLMNEITKSWEAWVTVICTIISISITFPLITNLLTGMGEAEFPILAKNKITFFAWRSILVCTAIGIGLLLALTDCFGALIGLAASIFMVPIQFMIPCIFYMAAKKKASNGAGVIKAVGPLMFTAMCMIILVSLVFMGVGIYQGITSFK